MFKKRPTFKSTTPVRSSDRRRLADRLISSLSLPSSTDRALLLAPSTSSTKFSTTHGADLTPVHGTLYTGSPIEAQATRVSWISLSLPRELGWPESVSHPNEILVPSVYTLWRMPNLLPRIRTGDQVLERVFGGADLMLPGVWGVEGEVRKGGLVGVVGDRGVVMAVGVADVERGEMEERGGKGRAVRMLHWWGDEVWKVGDGEEVAIPEGKPDELSESLKELKVDEEGAAGEQSEGKSAEPATAAEEPEKEDEIRELTTKEIDTTFHSATLFGLHVHSPSAPPTKSPPPPLPSFPLTSSLFLTHLVLPFLPPASYFPPYPLLQNTAPHPSLSIKKSSYKKADKFLKALDKDGLIKIKTRGGGETVVLDCNWHDERVATFAPYKLPVVPKEKPTEDAGGGGGGGKEAAKGKRQVELMYQPTKKVHALVEACGKSKTDYFSASDLKQMLNGYITANNLPLPRNPRLVGPDPVLSNTLLPGNNTREALLNAFVNGCALYHRLSPTAKLHKGPPPKITITLEPRGGNKNMTRVEGLEAFEVDPKKLRDILSVKCAGSASVGQAVGRKAGLMEVMVQGVWDGVVKEVLGKEWGVGKGECEVVDKCKKKK